ncbi:MAG: helix-turn-helix transcriptional regulator [Erysipelotrichaceae bacterium]
MNRTALCLRMLQLLKARGKMQRFELATLLDTNVRNIPEFKKELEIAGYYIESTNGKHGGYRLLDKDLLPSLALDKKEVASVHSALDYLVGRGDFISMESFRLAMDKVLATTKEQGSQQPLYLAHRNKPLSQELKAMMDEALLAKEQSRSLTLSYQKLKAKTVETYTVQPYEIIYHQDAYYLVAYALERKAFRTYKFSDARMKGLRIQERRFTRDLDFKISQVLGDVGLIKDEAVELQLKIYGTAAVLYSEKSVGIELHKVLKQDVLELTTIMEGEQSILSFLLSMGSDVEIVAPIKMRKLWIAQVQKMMERGQEKRG